MNCNSVCCNLFFKSVLARNFELRSLFHVELFGGCVYIYLAWDDVYIIRFIFLFVVSLSLYKLFICSSINCYFNLKIFFVYGIQEPSLLNERLVLLLPAAVYALCAGCEPFTLCYKEIHLLQSFVDVIEVADDWIKVCYDGWHFLLWLDFWILYYMLFFFLINWIWIMYIGWRIWSRKAAWKFWMLYWSSCKYWFGFKYSGDGLLFSKAFFLFRYIWFISFVNFAKISGCPISFSSKFTSSSTFERVAYARNGDLYFGTFSRSQVWKEAFVWYLLHMCFTMQFYLWIIFYEVCIIFSRLVFIRFAFLLFYLFTMHPWCGSYLLLHVLRKIKPIFGLSLVS